MKTLHNIFRASSLFIQGYIFGSRFGRFEFRRSFLRPWLNTLGMVGAWVLTALGCAAVAGVAWLLLWGGYSLGFTM